MSIATTTWALHDAPTKSAQELVILWGLADAAHSDGTSAFPKQATLAKFGRCDERTVRRHLRALEERGLIRRGDQRLVAHLPKDRRPIVWDLDMSMRRDDDPERVDNCPKRPDNLSPRDRTSAAGQPERADTVVPPRGATGDRSPGDTAAPSIEPSFRTVHRTGDCLSGVRHHAPAPAVDNPSPVSNSRDDDPAGPPQPWCANHPGGTETPCGPCGDQRRARKAWETEQAAAQAAATRAEVIARNRDEADQIAACESCDVDGYVGPGLKCLHDPCAIETARRGADKVRAALAARPRRHTTPAAIPTREPVSA
ncbi:helix-turn-helix domain-containing protein [Nocardia panacis]|uniref:Helix-turn-helix domain-containing protein n=1 Tax=Nocardia panacis TaxID=2340916 RepID=A0A3A4JQC4_9NOCA|nr:helix-turn-helix domain-containing protein [Nocardia panacis]RJO71427.1 helix-turn-helix domain-containing protein [Nocardia panacis]